MSDQIFKSVFAKDLAAFMAFKRGLGYSYDSAEFVLRSFDRYVLESPRGRPQPVDRLVRSWLTRDGRRKPVTMGKQMTIIRQFFLFCRRRDPKGYVPDRSWVPRRASVFVPHVFSPAEVRVMLAAAKEMAGPPLRGQTYRLLLLILFCTGLRLGEAVRLQLGDVDVAGMVFHVRESKGKTRLVPFRSDLSRELAKYLRARPPSSGGHTRFLVQPDGRPYRSLGVSNTLRAMFRRTGLKPASGRIGPRPTDFRHTFAVRRLTLWYRAGVDLHARLPWLSAYMGHKDLLSTQVYLTATPELLAVASRRFANRLHRARRG